MKESNMLDPSMSKLMENIDNRYLLVNITALRARDIAQYAEDSGRPLESKPVTIALHEIANREVEVAEEY